MLTKNHVVGICSAIAGIILVLIIVSKMNEKSETSNNKKGVFDTFQIPSRVVSYHPSFVEIGSFGEYKVKNYILVTFKKSKFYRWKR